jgi:hypothetical protein
MTLRPEGWTILLFATNGIAFVLIGLLAWMARRAIVDPRLRGLSLLARLALTLGISRQKDSIAVRSAIGRVRIRLALLILIFGIYVVGNQWLRERTERAVGEWISPFR